MRKENEEKAMKLFNSWASSSIRIIKKRKYNITFSANSNKMAIYKYVQKHAVRRKTCEICGKKDVNAHHEDYKQRLNVIYLCRSCHMKRHHYRKEFINNDKTKSVFKKHGFDIVKNVENDILHNEKHYMKYYKDYFCKQFKTRSKTKMEKQYTTQYSALKKKGMHAVTILLPEQTFNDLEKYADASYSVKSKVAVKIITEYLNKALGK